MKQLNCEMFELKIQFDRPTFKEKKFSQQISDEEFDIEIGTFVTHYTGKNEHAHIEISLDGEESRLLISFHEGGIEEQLDATETPLENALQEISKLFTKKKFAADFTAIFKFEQNYVPLINLQFPLISDNDLLTGAMVSGYEIEFPDDPLVDRMFISQKNDAIIALLSGEVILNLTNFDAYPEIKTVSEYPMSLLKEKKDEKNRKKN